MPFIPKFLVLSFVLSFVAAARNPKRGLAFADSSNHEDVIKANQSNSVISWQYDWGTSSPSYLAKSGIAYIPMQWGASGVENFAAQVKAKGATTILVSWSACHIKLLIVLMIAQGFNEPDFATQSNITPSQAAQLWKQYIQPLKASGVKLGGSFFTTPLILS